MSTKTKVIGSVGAVAILLVGIGIGGASADDSEPETKTVTEIVTEAPDACMKALDAADKRNDIYASVIDIVSGYPPMIAEAAQAGFDMDTDTIDSITERIKKKNSQISDSNDAIEKNNEAYIPAAKKCRAASHDDA